MTVSEAVLIIREKMFERKIYSHCENEIKVGERILNIRREKHMICNNCGREIRDDSKFCGVCGAEVTHNQTGVQKPVSGKTNRYLVILIIISLLIVIILGIMIGLLIHRQKEYDRKHDSSNEYTESFQTDSEDDSVEIIIDQQEVLVPEETAENDNPEICEQGTIEDKEYVIPNAFYEMEVSYGEEKINTANAFLEENGVANQPPFFIWGLDEHHPDCIIYYDTEKEKGCLFRLSYSGYDLAQIIGYTMTLTRDESFKPDIPGKGENPFLFKFIELDFQNKAKDICPSCEEKHTPDYTNGKVSEYVATGVLPDFEEEGEQTFLSLQWFYREDGSLQRRIYHHSPHSVGTAWSDVDTYYDKKGRILYENYYVTSGNHDIYAIYPEDKLDAYYVDIDPMAGNDLYIYHMINDTDYMNGCYYNLSFEEKIDAITNNYLDIENSAETSGCHACDDFYLCDDSIDYRNYYGHEHYYPEKISSSINWESFNEIRDKYPEYEIDYYYQNWEVSYVCVHNDTEEYRFYLDINQPHKCIRYIGPDGKVQDFEDGIDAKDIVDIGVVCDYDDEIIREILLY